VRRKANFFISLNLLYLTKTIDFKDWNIGKISNLRKIQEKVLIYHFLTEVRHFYLF